MLVFCKDKGVYRAYIMIKRKYKFLGYFKYEMEAAEAYNKAAINVWGEFACLNSIQDMRA